MAIVRAAGPVDGQARAGAEFAASRPRRERLELEAGGAEALIAQPIPTFSVEIATLAEAGLEALEAAHRTGWRYLAVSGDSLSLVDIPEQEDRSAELLTGSEAGGNLAASGRLAEELVRDAGEYEPRVLDLNLIGNSVLWLRARDAGDSDRFVTLGPEPHEIGGEELIGSLQRAAEEKLVSMRTAQGEAGG